MIRLLLALFLSLWLALAPAVAFAGLTVNQLTGFNAATAATAAATAIEFVGSNSNSSTGATYTVSLTALTGGISSSAASGDLVVAIQAVGSTSNLTLGITDGSTDYTLIGSELYTSDTFDSNLRVAYKFITSDTSVTFGGVTVNNGNIGIVMVFRNVDPTTPLDVAAVTATGQNTGNANPPAITPTTAGSYVVAVGGAGHDLGDVDFTSSDLTNFVSNSRVTSNESTGGAGYIGPWSSGSVDPAAFSLSGTGATHSWTALTLALRPAP